MYTLYIYTHTYIGVWLIDIGIKRKYELWMENREATREKTGKLSMIEILTAGLDL